ncbi:MAG: YjbE family integral membrane protein [Paracoccaceae bacterium]|jgi:YjbE family integral membrane protein
MENITQIVQIIFADIILSGDNAIIIGMSAASLSPELRKKAIIFGMAIAAGLRIFFAAIASYLLAIPGIIFFGGCLLLFVCWRFFIEISPLKTASEQKTLDQIGYTGSSKKQLISALITITIADVSMSIDNVLAVASIARENTLLLIFGLVLAIAFMSLFATIIVRMLTRYSWLKYLGFFFLCYLSLKMLYDGWPEVYHFF